MPRTARASVGGICYHVINGGNARREVFLKDGDYHAFLKAMAHASIEVPIQPFGSEPWQERTARALNLAYTFKSRGRPRKPVTYGRPGAWQRDGSP